MFGSRLRHGSARMPTPHDWFARLFNPTKIPRIRICCKKPLSLISAGNTPLPQVDIVNLSTGTVHSVQLDGTDRSHNPLSGVHQTGARPGHGTNGHGPVNPGSCLVVQNHSLRRTTRCRPGGVGNGVAPLAKDVAPARSSHLPYAQEI
jgi:hypothetical protein